MAIRQNHAHMMQVLGDQMNELAAIFITTGVVSLMIALLGFYLASQQQSDGALGCWAAGSFVSALSSLLFAFRPEFPQFLTIVVANCAAAAGPYTNRIDM